MGGLVVAAGGSGSAGGVEVVVVVEVVAAVVAAGGPNVVVVVAGGGGLGSLLALSLDLVVDGVETLGLGAVEVEPPIADEVLLVEDGAVGAEEGEGAQVGLLGVVLVDAVDADVEGLALGVDVGVVS